MHTGTNKNLPIQNLFNLYNSNNFRKLEKECYKLIKKNVRSQSIYNLLGVSLTKQFKLQKAINIFKSSLDINANNTDTLINLGLAQKEANLFKEAENSYSKAIEINPNSFEAYINLSDLYINQKDFYEGLKHARHASIININSSEPFCNIGNAFAGLQNFILADQNYKKSLELHPNSSITRHNYAVNLINLKKFKEAKVILEDSFKRKIHMNKSLIDYALCLFELGELDNSIEQHQRAISALPRNYQPHNNFGNLLLFLGKVSDAIENFNIAKKLSPNNPLILYNLARAENNEKNYAKALELCKAALEINPNFYKALNLAALIHKCNNRLEYASNCFEEALKTKPNDNEVLFNYGQHCLKLENYEKAIKLLTKAKSNNCPYPELEYYLANANYNLLGIDEAIEDFLKILSKSNVNKSILLNSLLLLNYSDSLSVKEIFNLHRRSDENGKIIHLTKNDNNKINIGYISSDFRTHSVVYFISNILKNHDKSKFQITCYYNNNYDDKDTYKIKRFACSWRNIFEKSDDYVSDLIKQDKIDILVDLNGHTSGNRLGVFKNRSAYKQITWLGYPNTTGLINMDYRFTDNFADPDEINNKEFYTEKLYKLPNTFLCYNNEISAKVSDKIPYTKNKFITFGSFNNLNKINATTLKLWSEILLVNTSFKLLLKSPARQFDDTKDRFVQKFLDLGVKSDQLIFKGRRESKVDHLELYNEIDIALDTYPYNGATTTFESLWMGVPVITLCGDRHASRVGNSILRNLCLDEFIANSKYEYVDIAKSQTKKIERISYLKKNLRSIMLKSTLCDDVKFTKNVEKAYEDIFKS